MMLIFAGSFVHSSKYDLSSRIVLLWLFGETWHYLAPTKELADTNEPEERFCGNKGTRLKQTKKISEESFLRTAKVNRWNRRDRKGQLGFAIEHTPFQLDWIG